jgi:uncharacterized protein DUF6221
VAEAASAIADFVKARNAEDHHFAQGLMFACRDHRQAPDFYACGGPAAEAFWQRFDARRMLQEVTATLKLLDLHERLCRENERNEAALAELRAAIAESERTGRWDSHGFPDTRRRAIAREADYLGAMMPHVESLLRDKAAAWNRHPDYKKKEWAPW